MDERKICLLTGGCNSERNVALAGAAEVAPALRACFRNVSVVDTVVGVLSAERERETLLSAVGKSPPAPDELRDLKRRDLGAGITSISEVQDSDLVFLMLHGLEGEGGYIQAVLELAGMRYTGSGVLGSSLAMDKQVSRRVLGSSGIDVAPGVAWPQEREDLDRLRYPLVVKPSRVGSTVGLSLVEVPEDLAVAIATAKRYDSEVIIEQFIEGREFTVGVLGHEALAVGEIISKHRYFDYECKYTPGMSREEFPAAISKDQTVLLQHLAVKAHDALKLRDYSRVDFRVDTVDKPYCLEANTLPGMTATSLLPQSAAASGIEFEQFCEKICLLALDRA
jgi:D-alanine-D-alanine ligase